MSEETAKREGEVEVVQYIRPNGRQGKRFASVGAEHAKKAEGMVLTTECIDRNAAVSVAARWADEPEEKETIELATNGPGPDSPVEVLKRLIDRKFAERETKK